VKRLFLLCLLPSAALAADAPADPRIRTQSYAQICYHRTAEVRLTTPAMKRKAYRTAGLSPTSPGCPCEVDHIVPLAAGGADSLANLQIQSYSGRWNAHMKDALEALSKELICKHKVTPAEAQSWFLGDWRPYYIQYFGAPAYGLR
jgi:hypothetical protein